MSSSFQIAIDGPVAAGKGTIARLLAKKLGFLYVDTGAMYRATALLAEQFHIDWNDEPKLSQLVQNHTIELRQPEKSELDGRQMTVLIDNIDVSWKVRTEEISQGASIVSQYKGVREELVRKQQAIARNNNVVMEGRDTTFKVLPKAQLKFYLDADPNIRAQRRYQELLRRGAQTTLEDVFKSMMERDTGEKTRAVDPLHVAEGVEVIDTTNLAIEDVVEVIVQRVKEFGYAKA